jgi:uncharacterized membrane protein HdeD (DUF308 family)
MKKSAVYEIDTVYSSSLTPNWWIFVLRGVFSIVFGSIALFMPITTILIMVLIFGVYAVVDGVLYIISGINFIRKGKIWRGLISSGIIGILSGLIVLSFPYVSVIGLSSFLMIIISFWAITTGFLEIIVALRLRKEIKEDWFLVLAGVLSITLGIGIVVLLIANPLVISLVTLGLIIGASSLAYGATLIALGLKLLRSREATFSGRTKITSR